MTNVLFENGFWCATSKPNVFVKSYPSSNPHGHRVVSILDLSPVMDYPGVHVENVKGYVGTFSKVDGKWISKSKDNSLNEHLTVLGVLSGKEKDLIEFVLQHNRKLPQVRDYEYEWNGIYSDPDAPELEVTYE